MKLTQPSTFAGGLLASEFWTHRRSLTFIKFESQVNGMESTTALMFVVVGASIGLFGMALLNVIQTFQHIKLNTI